MRADEHETQRLSILFPASPDAHVRKGDLIDYQLVKYLPMGPETEEDKGGR